MGRRSREDEAYDYVVVGAGTAGCVLGHRWDLSCSPGWRANGYHFVAGPDDVEQLRRNFETQRAYGVDAEWLEPAELGARHPELRVDDLAGAVLSPRDGWLDPAVFVAGVRAQARAAGVRLEAGGVLTGDAEMVSAGTWTPQLVAPPGMTLQIEPMRRHEHQVTAAGPGRTTTCTSPRASPGTAHARPGRRPGADRALPHRWLRDRRPDEPRYARVEAGKPYAELRVR